jgi:hypothetical protein
MRMLFIFLVLFPISAANSGEFTAHQLFQYCSDAKGSPGGISCSAWVSGFVEGLLVGKLLPEAGLTFCPPKDLSGLQARLLVENWIRQHPKELNEQASKVSMAALLTAYPCPAKNSN